MIEEKKRTKPSALGRAKRLGIDVNKVLDNRPLMEALAPKPVGRKKEWDDAKIGQFIRDMLELEDRHKRAGLDPYFPNIPYRNAMAAALGWREPKRGIGGGHMAMARDLLKEFPDHYLVRIKCGASYPRPERTLARYIANLPRRRKSRISNTNNSR